MIRLGLTGSIGMGKSTTAGLFRLLGVPVHDADRAVHWLLAPGGAAVSPILAAFPGAADAAGGIDRAALGRLVFTDPAALRRLEAILHPLVRREETRYLAALARRRLPLVVLDVPLLFETGGERRCDAVAVVSAPYFLQQRRVLARPGMTREKLAGILARQIPDQVKGRRADAVVQTGIGRRPALRQILSLLHRLRVGVDRRRGTGLSLAPRRPGGFR